MNYQEKEKNSSGGYGLLGLASGLVFGTVMDALTGNFKLGSTLLMGAGGYLIGRSFGGEEEQDINEEETSQSNPLFEETHEEDDLDSLVSE